MILPEILFYQHNHIFQSLIYYCVSHGVSVDIQKLHKPWHGILQNALLAVRLVLARHIPYITSDSSGNE